MGLSAGSLLALGGGHLAARVTGNKDTAHKVIVLGLDGLDPHLIEVWMNQGKLPAMQKLREMGSFSRLGTSNPPQSPVAWSNFTTGMNPGGHGLYDFLHRIPESYTIIASGAATSESSRTFSLGKYELPLSGGGITNTRQGRAFWQILEDHDIPATIFKMPANYPPVETKQRTLSGLNTTDLLGTPGIFNYYTTAASEINEDLGGGRVHEVYVIGNRVESSIPGPVNAFRKDRVESKVDFKVFLDPEHAVAKIVIQDEEFILKEGEWSGWKHIRFNLMPTQSISGICQFYLKQVRPDFKLYVSPTNIDPGDPALPISTPNSYAKELERRFGPFYTQGLPADTKALSNNILDDGEFLAQDDIVLQERLKMYDYELDRFDSGLLFYYLSSADQRQHMLWRHIDKSSPLHDDLLASEYGGEIEKIYRIADSLVDKALQKADKNTTVLVLSDHGFAPFRHSFNLNTWLKESGYISLIDPWKQGDQIMFLNTDWSKSRAYSIGLNSIYINQRGREGEGIVIPGAEKRNLIREIARRLEEYKDPKTGENPVLHAYPASDVYSGSAVDGGPDIVAGFNRGWRISWASPMGRMPKEIALDNTEKWSGDHCASPAVVPGVFFSNRQLTSSTPALYDLTASILNIFGIPVPDNMVGKPILKI